MKVYIVVEIEQYVNTKSVVSMIKVFKKREKAEKCCKENELNVNDIYEEEIE